MTATSDTSPDGSPSGSSARRRTGVLLAAPGYLVLAVLLFWPVWSGHPTSTTTCGCGDSSLFTWFLEWPAYAITHGHNPLYSTAMSYPGGVNLLSNTSELAIGVVLAPVTWLFGPVATLNVALTLAPALSALAMFVLLRRWVTWTPAAFVGGLCYGFSPFILVSLTDGHLMNGMAPVPPLIVLCLDELFFGRARRPIVTGLVLGLLVTVQFFIGTELLLMVLITVAMATVLVVAYAVVRNRGHLRRRAGPAAVGLLSAGVTTIVLLGYPVWFALAGPAHTSGPVWPDLYLGYEATTLKAYLVPGAVSSSFTTFTHRVGGYQGPTLSGQYFGVGLAAVVLVGLVVWRRDRRLWLFGALTAVSVVLSLGANPHYWLPWQVAAGLPLLQNVIPSRFLSVTYLTVAVLLGLIVDHVYVAVAARPRARPSGTDAPSVTGPGDGGPGDSGRRRLAGIVAVAVAAVALVPVAGYLSASAPMTARPVVLPTWFRTVAPRLEGHPVLLVFPVPYQTIESAMTWQAVDRMHYSMVGGGGPGGIPARGGPEAAGQAIIGDASFSFARQTFTAAQIPTVRRALDEWGVTMVVIPDAPGLAPYDRVTSVPFAVGMMTAATGTLPVYQAGAWVWPDVVHAGPPVLLGAAPFAGCTAGATGTPASVMAVARCVVAATAGRS